MALNTGYAYREQLGARARGQSTLSYLVDVYRHSPVEVWRERPPPGGGGFGGLPPPGGGVF